MACIAGILVDVNKSSSYILHSSKSVHEGHLVATGL